MISQQQQGEMVKKEVSNTEQPVRKRRQQTEEARMTPPRPYVNHRLTHAQTSCYMKHFYTFIRLLCDLKYTHLK